MEREKKLAAEDERLYKNFLRINLDVLQNLYWDLSYLDTISSCIRNF